MDEIRSFIAVELSEQVKQALRAAQKQLKQATGAPAVRWVSPDNMHLTLKFLGNVPRSQVDELAQGIHEAVSGVAPFSLNAHGLGCFTNTRKPNVIWIGLNGEVARIVDLAHRIDDALVSFGLAREDRPFSPHLTLGRIDRQARLSDRAAIGEAIQKSPAADYGAVPVEAIHLIQSDLRPGGPVYTVLRTVKM